MRTLVPAPTIAVLLALVGACDPHEKAGQEGPLATLTEGLECLSRVTGRPSQQLYRWLAGQRRLEMAAQSVTAGGLKLSTFVYQLDEQDRLLSREELIGGVPEWRLLYTLDERGNPLTYVYEWQGQPGARGEYLNTYDGDRLIRVDLTWGLDSDQNRIAFIYQHDDQGRRIHERIEREGMAMTDGPEEKWITFDDEGRLESIRQTHQDGEKSLTTYAHDQASRLEVEVIDGGPNLGDRDGTADVNTRWSYDSRGRLLRVVSRSARLDVLPVDRDNSEHLFAPGCEAFQGRFPGIFGLPAALSLP